MRFSKAKSVGSFRVYYPSLRRVTAHAATLGEARKDAAYWSHQVSKPIEIQERLLGGWMTVEIIEPRASKRAHSTKRTIPGVGKWNTYAGGTTAAAGKHSYDLYVPEGQYTITPISDQYGRHRGYSLKFAATGARPRSGSGGLWHDLGMHRSPASAAKKAAEHYARGFE